MRHRSRNNTYIDGYGCNGGAPASSANTTSQSEINKSILDEGARILDACHDALSFTYESGKYIVQSAFNSVDLELGIECPPITIAPNVTVSAKVAQENTVYVNHPATYEFDIINGVAVCNDDNVKKEIEATMTGFENNGYGTDESNCLMVFDTLSAAVKDGNMKIEIETGVNSAGETYFKTSYAVLKEHVINASCTETMSFTYSITITIPDDNKPSWEPALAKIEDFKAYIVEHKDTIITVSIIAGFLALFLITFLSGGTSSAATVPAMIALLVLI